MVSSTWENMDGRELTLMPSALDLKRCACVVFGRTLWGCEDLPPAVDVQVASRLLAVRLDVVLFDFVWKLRRHCHVLPKASISSEFQAPKHTSSN